MRAGVFPGQGLDSAAVASALPVDHERLHQANDLLGYDLRRAVERSGRTIPTRVAQPAILTAGAISFEQSLADGVAFDYLFGHSLGEYTALVAGGAIPFRQGLRLVAARGETMARAANRLQGGMVVVSRFDAAWAEALATAHGVVVANDNSPDQIVLSGADGALTLVARAITAEGGRVRRLAVEGPFHSPAMEPAVADLDDALAHIAVRNPKIPVISNVSARPYRAPGEIRKLLLAQLTGRVRFRESVEWLVAHGVTDFVDLGPGRVVERLVRKTLGDQVQVAHA